MTLLKNAMCFCHVLDETPAGRFRFAEMNIDEFHHVFHLLLSLPESDLDVSVTDLKLWKKAWSW